MCLDFRQKEKERQGEKQKQSEKQRESEKEKQSEKQRERERETERETERRARKKRDPFSSSLSALFPALFFFYSNGRSRLIIASRFAISQAV
jgi:hypothetical protein